ncbi:MAG: hypothetical protein ACK4Z6_02225 [Candidatus Methylomirabilales bacterium]
MAQEQARAQGYLQGLEQALQEPGVAATIEAPVARLAGPAACQVQLEDASYGPFILWLMAFTGLVSTTRCLFRGRVTMEEPGFSLKHPWRFLDAEALG